MYPVAGSALELGLFSAARQDREREGNEGLERRKKETETGGKGYLVQGEGNGY